MQFVELIVEIILVLKLADMLVSLSQGVEYPLPSVPTHQVFVTEVRDEKLGISMLATRSFHVSQEEHLWCSIIASTCGGSHARPSLADFRPTPEVGSCRSTFSAHSQKDVTMVTTRITFHHPLAWTRMTTNASHYWHSSYSTGSNHGSVDCQHGW